MAGKKAGVEPINTFPTALGAEISILVLPPAGPVGGGGVFKFGTCFLILQIFLRSPLTFVLLV